MTCVSIPDLGKVSKGANLMVESYCSSSRDLVGLQLWRGAFLLAEYLWAHPKILESAHVLELGAGTGLTSLVAALKAKSVTCTGTCHWESSIT